MTYEIGNILASFLEPLRIGGLGSNQFIDKLAGVVKAVVKTDKDSNNISVRKTFPVACGISFAECNTTSIYKDLIPNSNLGCIVYFEDIGVRYIGEQSTIKKWKASYRLVCWINQKKLGYNDCSITSQILNTFLDQFPKNAFNSGNYQMCSIDILGQDPKSFNPFSKYSYDEDKTQYLMHPFDYFSIQIDVNFSVNSKCLLPFTKQTEINCN